MFHNQCNLWPVIMCMCVCEWFVWVCICVWCLKGLKTWPPVVFLCVLWIVCVEFAYMLYVWEAWKMIEGHLFCGLANCLCEYSQVSDCTSPPSLAIQKHSPHELHMRRWQRANGATDEAMVCARQPAHPVDGWPPLQPPESRGRCGGGEAHFGGGGFDMYTCSKFSVWNNVKSSNVEEHLLRRSIENVANGLDMQRHVEHIGTYNNLLSTNIWFCDRGRTRAASYNSESSATTHL